MKKAFSARDVLILNSQIPHIKPVQGYTQRGTFFSDNPTNKNASFQVSEFEFFFRRLLHGAASNLWMINELERTGQEAVGLTAVYEYFRC